MKFDDNELDSSSRLSQYVRLHLETNAKDVVKFMRQAWELPPPDLIISVTGGAKHCDMSARLRKIFQRGLVAAAVTTSKISQLACVIEMMNERLLFPRCLADHSRNKRWRRDRSGRSTEQLPVQEQHRRTRCALYRHWQLGLYSGK